MMKYVEKSGSNTHSVGYTYDNLNNLTALKETFGDTERIISYAYDGDNRPTSITAGNSTLSYTYDAYGRVSTLTPKHDGNTFATKEYTYKQNSNGAPTNQVSVVTISDGDDNPYYTATYTYDQNGNITGINTTITTEDKETTYETSYAYDSANQLIREDNQEAGTTTLWTYDNAGNILTRTVHPYNDVTADNGTQTKYIYNSNWGDQLKVYNSRIIHCDEIGNPLSDYTWDYTWKHGRQLASMVRLGTTEKWDFTYNADGLRTQRTKTVTDLITGKITTECTYQYTYNGDKLTHMTVDGHTMYFTYDASGSPMSVTYDGEHYYYVTNLQGDVIAIVEGDGDEFVRYTYDAWGNPISPTDDMAGTLGFYNPLRYRGYVYDPETELYYLQSRYYNPDMGRFINVDKVISGIGGDIIGCNLFSYCFNDPINMSDSTGAWPVNTIPDFWCKTARRIVASTMINHVVNARNQSKINDELQEKYSTTSAKEEIDKILVNYGDDVYADFNDTGVEIKNSIKVKSRYDRQKISTIISRTEDITDREYDDLSAEWLFHNIAYYAFIERESAIRESAINADLDYGRDRRWFVVFATDFLEFWGWE